MEMLDSRFVPCRMNGAGGTTTPLLLVLRWDSRNEVALFSALLGLGIGEAYMFSRRRVGALRGAGSCEPGPSFSSATPMYRLLGCRCGSR